MGDKSGATIHLDNGRSVSVWRADENFGFCFTNERDEKTSFLLRADATDALVTILLSIRSLS